MPLTVMLAFNCTHTVKAGPAGDNIRVDRRSGDFNVSGFQHLLDKVWLHLSPTMRTDRRVSVFVKPPG
jgi:hypothetical protein